VRANEESHKHALTQRVRRTESRNTRIHLSLNKVSVSGSIGWEWTDHRSAQIDPHKNGHLGRVWRAGCTRGWSKCQDQVTKARKGAMQTRESDEQNVRGPCGFGPCLVARALARWDSMEQCARCREKHGDCMFWSLRGRACT